MVNAKFKPEAREYKRLNAQVVQPMVIEGLQEQIPLEMTGRAYNPV